MEDKIRKILKDKIPQDDAKQSSPYKILEKYKQGLNPKHNLKVLDFGAGTGRAYENIKSILDNFEYIGLDIDASPEVSKRNRKDIQFVNYDGKTFPFNQNHFDIVFSQQVLEHVRYPDQVLSEVHRVLKPGGRFIGSVSQLEPYHSYSIFNFTIYGIITLFESNALIIEELRPGIDGISIILRRFFGKEYFSSMFSGLEGLFNHMISAQFHGKKDIWSENFNKLIYSAHIIFQAKKQ